MIKEFKAAIKRNLKKNKFLFAGVTNKYDPNAEEIWTTNFIKGQRQYPLIQEFHDIKRIEVNNAPVEFEVRLVLKNVPEVDETARIRLYKIQPWERTK